MTLAPSGILFLGPNPQVPNRSIASEFGGSAPYDLQNYYRGGGLVPDFPQNSNIPTSGVIDMQDFYGSSSDIPVFVDPGSVVATSLGAPGASASIEYNENGETNASAIPSGSGSFDDWLIAGSSGDFEIRATVDSGVTPIGSPINVWLSLSSSRSWRVSVGGNSGDVDISNLTVAIRAAGGSVLSSGAITLSAENIIT